MGRAVDGRGGARVPPACFAKEPLAPRHALQGRGRFLSLDGVYCKDDDGNLTFTQNTPQARRQGQPSAPPIGKPITPARNPQGGGKNADRPPRTASNVTTSNAGCL